MITAEIIFVAKGDTLDEALEALRFDIDELMRRTGDGGDAELENYVNIGIEN